MLLTLQSKKEEVPGVISFIFHPEQPLTWVAGPPATPSKQGLAWRAGQFMQYTLGNDKRYFTISSAPHEQNIMLTTRFAREARRARIDPNKCSDFKKTLLNMQTGQTIEATGPHGSFVLEDPSQNYVFIAGGIGITPFRSILLDLNHKNLPINVTLLYANRDQNIIFKEELEKLVKPLYFIDPQKIDEKNIQLYTKPYSLLTYFISGPEPFVLILEKLLSNMGVLDENIMRDYFPGYDRI